MRAILWCSILSAALATGACKKKQDDTGAAATEVKKTATNVDDQRKDFEETATNKGSTEKELNKAEADVAAAKADLAAARDKYSITVKDRLSKLDIRIHELENRTDAKSKDALDKLRTRRTELSTKIDAMNDRAAADWDAFTKDVDSTFDTIEKDVGNALK
jgi:predicted  nucleic acid-binding Zn-ribbon protein